MTAKESERALDVLSRKPGSQVAPEVPARNDWRASLPQRPLAVVRETVGDCRKAPLPFLRQGGMTGHCRCAAPDRSWVAISLEQVVGIGEIDRNSGTTTVKGGTPLETIRAADDADLLFRLDLGSCAIDGSLPTNTGGMTRELLRGQVVLSDENH